MNNIMTIVATRKSAFVPAVITAIFFLIFPLFGGGYHVHVFLLVFLNITLAMSYRVGYVTGLGSFCHISFFAIGAYTSALMAINTGAPWGIGFICGGLIAAGIAAIFAWPTVRARGPYFFILSFGLFFVIDMIIRSWTGLTGGQSGLMNIPEIAGLSSVTDYYYVALVFAALTILFMWRLNRSRFGRELTAVGDADNLAEVTGINVDRHRIIAFAISAFFAGLAGSIYAHYLGYITPQNFDMMSTLFILIWVVVGGAGKVWGPIAGAMFLTLMVEGTRVSGEMQAIIYAVALLTVILSMPRGIVGLVDRMRAKWVLRKGALNVNP